MNNLNNPERQEFRLKKLNSDQTKAVGKENSCFFSAKPKVMNLEMIYEPKEGSNFIPPPLSLKRNGFGSDFNYERDNSILGAKSSICPDEDVSGKYFGGSIREGPFMRKQEDRVSILFILKPFCL